jgi:hypothetical protein
MKELRLDVLERISQGNTGKIEEILESEDVVEK